MAKDLKGITVTKEGDFSDWFTQIIQKAELIDYSPVSGCYILRPAAYSIWEKVQQFFDALIKQDGVQNAYFPLFIPESLLTKEKEHVEGFAPEVAWVETGGQSKLTERLAVRPTSETIINDSYAKWIRSHRDLPLRLNQWCNVVRWEFKHCTPFLRSREFLWQEGHTAFATQGEAMQEVHKILDFYEKVFVELYAVPVMKGRKSEKEKFAGADITTSVETFLPNGKAIQGATSHQLGQNFAKAFGITFKDENQESQYVWQNSWGISTRSIGVMIMMHSDDKGLVLPPRIAATQVVVVPILIGDKAEAVMKKAKEIQKSLPNSYLDDREGYTPGWKFNEWEVKGIPLRIEIGPKDLEKKQVMIVRRDTGEKKAVPFASVDSEVASLLETIQSDLYTKAEKFMKESIIEVTNLEKAAAVIKEEKMFFAPWCGSPESEEKLKEQTGAKSLNAPFEQPSVSGKRCFMGCGEAKQWFYFGKSY
ncbi:proline--tRNA ligase [Candidatus Woesearchaeota archaeon CG10_big_fil_rev_8_21_14_0_10_45_16]|nr:MAG: proline--tRNA ligase [Candidatus Woesearchaeota archaeon CG10_big_fil_rev_8_21_14_0_10_45_16]